MSYSPYASLAEIYETIRPSYPAELIADIIQITGLSSNVHCMEIGAGTGKATEAFLQRDFYVDAIELDGSMAEILRRKCSSQKLKLCVGSFETWTPPRAEYDMIYCAQAFHWLDPETKFKKCRHYLSTGGYLALIWYDPQLAPNTPAQRAAEQIKNRYFGPSNMTTSVPMDQRTSELETAEGFMLHFQKQYSVTLQNTPKQSLLAMQSTPAFSEKFRQLSSMQQDTFIKEYTLAIEENGGTLDAPMLYSLYILKAV